MAAFGVGGRRQRAARWHDACESIWQDEQSETPSSWTHSDDRVRQRFQGIWRDTLSCSICRWRRADHIGRVEAWKTARRWISSPWPERWCWGSTWAASSHLRLTSKPVSVSLRNFAESIALAGRFDVLFPSQSAPLSRTSTCIDCTTSASFHPFRMADHRRYRRRPREALKRDDCERFENHARLWNTDMGHAFPSAARWHPRSDPLSGRHWAEVSKPTTSRRASARTVQALSAARSSEADRTIWSAVLGWLALVRQLKNELKEETWYQSSSFYDAKFDPRLSLARARKHKAAEHKTLRLLTFTKRFEFVIVRLHVFEKARLDVEQILPKLNSCEAKRGREKHFSLLTMLKAKHSTRLHQQRQLDGPRNDFIDLRQRVDVASKVVARPVHPWHSDFVVFHHSTHSRDTKKSSVKPTSMWLFIAHTNSAIKVNFCALRRARAANRVKPHRQIMNRGWRMSRAGGERMLEWKKSERNFHFAWNHVSQFGRPINRK